jgi:hypothetical protein
MDSTPSNDFFAASPNPSLHIPRGFWIQDHASPFTALYSDGTWSPAGTDADNYFSDTEWKKHRYTAPNTSINENNLCNNDINFDEAFWDFGWVSADTTSADATPRPLETFDDFGNVFNNNTRVMSPQDFSLWEGSGGFPVLHKQGDNHPVETESSADFSESSESTSRRESETATETEAREQPTYSYPNSPKYIRTPAKPSKTQTSRKRSSARSLEDSSAPSNKTAATGKKFKNGRYNHNLVEKQYRTRINNCFKGLLSKIPQEMVVGAGKVGTKHKKAISRGETLELAEQYIRKLEKEEQDLTHLNKEMSDDVERLKGEWMSMGGTIMPLIWCGFGGEMT